MAQQEKTMVVRFLADTKGLRSELDNLTGKFGGIAKSLAVVGSTSSVVPALTASLKAASGAAGVLPGVLAAVGVATAAAKVGMMGFSDAVEKGGEDLAKLSPNARKAATSIRNLGTAWTGVRKATQDALFKDLNKDINTLGGKYLPVLKVGLSGITAELNQGTRETAAYLARSAQVSTVAGIFNNVRGATDGVSKAMSPLLQILVDIVSVSAEFLPGLAGGFGSAAERAADFVNKARETGQLKQWIQGGLDALKGWGEPLKQIWTLITNVAAIAQQFFSTFSIGGETLLDTLVNITTLIREQGDWLIPLIAGFYALSKVLGIVNAVMATTTVVMNMSKVAIRALLITTGIGALVIAFVTLWETSAGFRDFWIDLWKTLVAAAKWAWENVLKPVVDAIVYGVTHIGEAWDWVWSNAIKPAIDAIADAAMWLWRNVIEPVVDGIAAAINFLMPIFRAFGGFVGFIFSMVQGAAEILWAALKFAFDMIGIAWQVLSALIEAVWTITIEPIILLFKLLFEGLGFAIQVVWVNVIKPVLGFLGDAFEWVWEKIIKPTIEAAGRGFQAMGDFFKWVYDHIIAPVLNGIGDLFKGMQKVVEGVVDGIKKAWDVIAKIFGTPVKWVVDVIWNNGIVKFWNWLADQLGMGKLNTIDTSGWPHFATGGKVQGQGTGKSDSIMAMVSNGEYVMPADKTQKYLPALEAMRQGRLPGFALGGVVGDVLNFVGGAIGDAARFISDPVGEFSKSIGINNGWAKTVANLPVKMITNAAEWLWKKISEFAAPEATDKLSTAELASRYKAILTAAIQWTHVGMDWLEPLAVLIRRESNWNPRAINNWDSNAAKGTPSMGLMQTIGPTFAAYRDPRLPNDPFHPMANIVAGINYIKARYGTIHNVQQANPNAAPRGYDQGGWLPPGYTNVYNGTGKPEMVLTQKQLNGLGNTYYLELHIHGAGNSKVDLMDQFDDMARMLGTSIVTQ